MLIAGDEFLQTQRGNNNPYNQDNETTWLDWSRQIDHADHLRFVKKMIAFRKAHPTLGRGRFWRDDVRWYGVGGSTDLSYDSHSLAYCLRGASQGDCDLYVMINAYHEPLSFPIQETRSGGWKRAIDTGLESPDDIAEPGREVAVTSMEYQRPRPFRGCPDRRDSPGRRWLDLVSGNAEGRGMSPMAIHPLAGQPAPASSLIDVGKLERAYHENRPDLADPFQLVAFGTSGHRGTPLLGHVHRSPHPGHHPGHLRLPPQPCHGRSTLHGQGHARSFRAGPAHGARGPGSQRRRDDHPARRRRHAHAGHLASHPRV